MRIKIGFEAGCHAVRIEEYETDSYISLGLVEVQSRLDEFRRPLLVIDTERYVSIVGSWHFMDEIGQIYRTKLSSGFGKPKLENPTILDSIALLFDVKISRNIPTDEIKPFRSMSARLMGLMLGMDDDDMTLAASALGIELVELDNGQRAISPNLFDWMYYAKRLIVGVRTAEAPALTAASAESA